MHSEILSETFQILLRKFLGITCFLIFGPFLVIILIFLYIYHCLVDIVLRIQLRNKFAGMLESSDAVWSIKDVSLSMATIVIILKKPVGSTNTIFLKNIRKFFSNLSKSVPTGIEKLFFYRYQKYGYFYWDKSHKFNSENAIRWLECKKNNCDGSCENAYSITFQENLDSICNRPLYDNHKPMWEMLIGRRCRKSSSYIEDLSSSSEDCFNTDIDEIPVVFRLHHSLCDGVAIFDVINKIIADEGMIKKQSSIMDFKNDSSTVKENQFKEKRRTVLKRKIISYLKQVYKKIKKITITIISILFGIEIWISQLVRSRKKSVLCGQPLTGEKLIFSCMENDTGKSLFMKIKRLKQCTGARVNDIIITAFAAGLIRYYSRIREVLPEAESVLIPTRMSTSTSDENVVLKNDFSFLMIESCFVDADKTNILTLNETCQFFKRLQRIKSTNNRIRNSLEASLNFFLIKRVCGLLPAVVLRLFSVLFCTMIFSNIKGPRRKIHIVKHPVSNMMFLIPSRNTIGVALTALTYEDKLNLSLAVDTALIKDRMLIKEIIEETVREINSAYDQTAR